MNFIWILCALTLSIPVLAASVPIATVPKGFKIEVLAEIPNAREMALSPKGTLFVGTHDDHIYAITREGLKPTKIRSLLTDLREPIGVAFQDGTLYVSSVDRIVKLKDIESHLDKPMIETITGTLPSEKHHGGRYLGFGPDKKLYLGIGAPCNVCDAGPNYANLTRMNPDGSQREVFAKGIRNTVGFDWHPVTHELWFTDNGRDLMGDDLPPDELNIAPKPGLDFGFPVCHAGTILDPEFGKGKSCDAFVKPVKNFGAHVASLGMRFYTGKMFPAEYQNQLFVAEHGSWNRSKKSGYRVMIAKLKGNEVVSYTPFIEGFLKGETASGRPVDLLVDQDGALLVSDDFAGVIYRVSYLNPDQKLAH